MNPLQSREKRMPCAYLLLQPLSRSQNYQVLFLTTLVMLGMRLPTHAEPPYVVEWEKQLSTVNDDRSFGLAVDTHGNSYITGWTWGSLAGPNKGDRDVFLAKFDPLGNSLWMHQLGTRDFEVGYSVAVDSGGNVFLTGITNGNLAGIRRGNMDAFLFKFDAAGNLLWKNQIGTTSWDYGNALAVDSLDHIYVAGWSHGSLGGPNKGYEDGFVAKYDQLGDLVWKMQMGTVTYDRITGIAVDSHGEVLVSGSTEGKLGNAHFGLSDAFIAKLDSEGNQLWLQQFGTTARDTSNAIAIDPWGNIFATGNTYGNLGGPNAGRPDVYLAKLDTNGNLLWLEQFGSTLDDYGLSVAVDTKGNAFVSGATFGDLGGPAIGLSTAFLAKFDSLGQHLWTPRSVVGYNDAGTSVAVNDSGVFMSGYTGGNAFITKFSPIPEPSSPVLAIVAILAWGRRLYRGAIFPTSIALYP